MPTLTASSGLTDVMLNALAAVRGLVGAETIVGTPTSTAYTVQFGSNSALITGTGFTTLYDPVNSQWYVFPTGAINSVRIYLGEQPGEYLDFSGLNLPFATVEAALDAEAAGDLGAIERLGFGMDWVVNDNDNAFVLLPGQTNADGVVVNLRGNDVFNLNGGNDQLWSGNGDDTVNGGLGNNVVWGGRGADSLIGGGGYDTLYGNQGNDTLNGGSGNDILRGNDGVDQIFGGLDDDTINGGNGNDILNGEDGADQIFGGLDDDTINGGSGNDILNGEDGADRILGGLGDDEINGDDGNDILKGEAGQDTLRGGTGDDRLLGGAEADTFVFQAGDGTDRIRDFDPTMDILRFEGLTDVVLKAGNGNGAVVTYDGGKIVLEGIDIANVDPADFVFA